MTDTIIVTTDTAPVVVLPDGAVSTGFPIAVRAGRTAGYDSAGLPALGPAIADLGNMVIDAAHGTGVFQPSVTDTYLRALIVEAHPENAEPGRSYVLNYETIYYSGIPLYRAQFYLYDPVLGKNVAQWAYESATIFTLPSTVFLSAVSGGVPRTDLSTLKYTGTTCTLWLDPAKVVWTKAVTAYTTPAQAGIRPANNVTNEMLDDFLVKASPRVHLLVGASQTYTSVLAAYRSLLLPSYGSATPLRSDFPISDIATPSNQVVIEVVDANYTEAIAPTTGLAGDQSTIVLPPYITLRLRRDTRLYMAAYGGTAPLFEAHRSCRIELNGGKLEQQGSGYVIHSDEQSSLSVPAAAGPPIQYWRNRQVITGGRLKSSAAAWIIGQGISDGSTTIVERCIVSRTAQTGYAFHGCHTSPSSVTPGRIIHRSNIANDRGLTDPAIYALTSHTPAGQHQIVVDDCDYGKVASGLAGGQSTSAFVRAGKMSGLTSSSASTTPDGSYASLLDPAF